MDSFSDKWLACPWEQTYRYVDDLISFNDKRFKEFISDIYPKELTISETAESTSVASYLDLLFARDKSNNMTTKLYDNRDPFSFHIANFPFMSSNIPSAPAYVYAATDDKFNVELNMIDLNSCIRSWVFLNVFLSFFFMLESQETQKKTETAWQI